MLQGRKKTYTNKGKLNGTNKNKRKKEKQNIKGPSQVQTKFPSKTINFDKFLGCKTLCKSEAVFSP